MSNPYFVALYSTDEVYVRQNQTECLSEELDAIKASIPDPVDTSNFAAVDHVHTGYAASEHTHSGYAASNHNHDSVYAAASHSHQPEAITAHMGNQTHSVTSGADYVTLPLTTSVIVGTGFTVENNVIKIGSGINKVRISAQVCVGTNNPAVKYLAIRANVNTYPTQLARAQMRSHEYTTPETMTIAPLVVTVSENDLLTLDFFGAEGDVIYGGITLSYITVEKLA